MYLVPDVVFEVLDNLFVRSAIDDIEEYAWCWFNPDLRLLRACGDDMNCDVFAKWQQAHAVPRRDGEGLVVAFNPLELAAPLYGLFGGGIDAAGGLAEVEGGFTHSWTSYFN